MPHDPLVLTMLILLAFLVVFVFVADYFDWS